MAAGATSCSLLEAGLVLLLVLLLVAPQQLLVTQPNLHGAKAQLGGRGWGREIGNQKRLGSEFGLRLGPT